MKYLLPWLVVLGLGAGGCVTNPVSSGGETTGRMGQERRQSSADVFVALASEYYRQGQMQPALTNAKKGVEADGSNPAAHTMLGIVYEGLGELDLAQQHLKRAVELDPRDSVALNAYGSLLCSRGAYAEAKGYFDRAVDNPLYQTPWVPLYNEGSCARSAGDQAQAETYLRRALTSKPDFAPALLSMARLSYETGQFLPARAYLERYRDAGQHTAESLLLAVQIERQLGDQSQAASYELLLRRRFPDSEQVQQLNSPASP